MQVSEEEKIVLASLDYETLIRYSSQNRTYRAILDNDDFWAFKVDIDTDYGRKESLASYFRTALFNGWYYIARHLLFRGGYLELDYITIKTLLLSTRRARTPVEKIVWLIYSFNPQLIENVFHLLQAAEYASITPEIFVRLSVSDNTMDEENGLLEKRLLDILSPLSSIDWEWVLEVTVLLQEKGLNLWPVLGTNLLTSAITNDKIGLAEKILDQFAWGEAPSLPAFLTYSKEMLLMLKNKPNFDWQTLVNAQQNNTNNEIRKILDLPPIPGKLTVVKAQKRKFKSTEVISPLSPFHAEISKAIQDKDFALLQELILSQDGHYAISFVTENGYASTFFLNEASLRALRDFLQQGQILDRDVTVSDYIYNFVIDPVLSFSLKKF